jgi:hypothetical protein
MESKENVNPGMEKGEFSKTSSGNRQNMQSQIVVCHSRDLSCIGPSLALRSFPGITEGG